MIQFNRGAGEIVMFYEITRLNALNPNQAIWIATYPRVTLTKVPSGRSPSSK